MSNLAKNINQLEYLFVEWVFNLCYPLFLFLISLFIICPLIMGGSMIIGSFYLFVKKHYVMVIKYKL